MARTRGLASLKRKLARLPDAAKPAIKAALNEAAAGIVGLQKRLAPVAPVDGGDLRDSIVATSGSNIPKYAAFRSRGGRVGDPDLSVVISAGNSKVRYAHLVEFGTAPHINGGRFKGTKHPGTAPQPFFFPGYRAGRKRAKSLVGRAVRASARKVAQGG